MVYHLLVVRLLGCQAFLSVQAHFRQRFVRATFRSESTISKNTHYWFDDCTRSICDPTNAGAAYSYLDSLLLVCA